LVAVLAMDAWSTVEKPAFRALIVSSRGDAAVLLVTLGLTLFRDLTSAIVVGFALGAMLFIHRMASAVAVHPAPRGPYHEEAADPRVVVYRIRGALFFGAVSAVSAALDRIGDTHRLLVLDFSEVTLVDSSAAHMIEGIARKAGRRGVAVALTGATPALRRDLRAHGVRPPLVRYAPSVEAALATFPTPAEAAE